VHGTPCTAMSGAALRWLLSSTAPHCWPNVACCRGVSWPCPGRLHRRCCAWRGRAHSGGATSPGTATAGCGARPHWRTPCRVAGFAGPHRGGRAGAGGGVGAGVRRPAPAHRHGPCANTHRRAHGCGRAGARPALAAGAPQRTLQPGRHGPRCGHQPAHAVALVCPGARTDAAGLPARLARGPGPGLQTTYLTVEAVAQQCGYGDVGSFRRIFARVAGVTPGAYRQRFRLRTSRRQWMGMPG
jgi:AraC-like DNA-binding protein